MIVSLVSQSSALDLPENLQDGALSKKEIHVIKNLIMYILRNNECFSLENFDNQMMGLGIDITKDILVNEHKQHKHTGNHVRRSENSDLKRLMKKQYGGSNKRKEMLDGYGTILYIGKREAESEHNLF